MVLTRKQRSARGITQTTYYPLPLFEDLDNTAIELGVSRNKLVNACTVVGLQHKDEVKEMLLEGSQATNQEDPQPAVGLHHSNNNNTITPPARGVTEIEVQ